MGFMDTLQKESSYSTASGNSYQYVVLQVTLKEKFIGTGSGNLTELENVINQLCIFSQLPYTFGIQALHQAVNV